MSKRRKQFLNRPLRLMTRFNKVEMREFVARVKRTGLSKAEYSRRKCLDQPIVDIVQA